MKRIGNILIGGSLLFFLETAFEMYVLTMLRGPQMIGFSMAHIARGLLILVLLSGLFYLFLGGFALIIVVAKLFGKLTVEDGYARLMLIVLIIQIIHTSLLMTYDFWSAILFSKAH